MTLPLLALAVLLAASPTPKGTRNWTYLDNGQVRLGVNMDAGGAVGWFSRSGSGENWVNGYDHGRYIQQSYYGDSDGSDWNGTPWRYNPVQGGSWRGVPATVLELRESNGSLYVKTRPRQWAGGKEVDDMLMEQWLSLDGGLARLKYRMTYTGAATHAARHQELPAVFVPPSCDTLVFCERGQPPWQNAELARRQPGKANEIVHFSEPWAAWVNAAGQGVGFWFPHADFATAYRVRDTGVGDCSYIAPLQTFALKPGLVFEYEVALSLGTAEQIRAAFTQLQRGNAAEVKARAATESPKPWGGGYLKLPADWYASAEARAVADNLLKYQSAEGGWPKNHDLTTPAAAETLAELAKSGKANTIDNGGTTLPLRFVGLMARATEDESYKTAFARGLDYLFAAQYPNGGWPQFFPLRPGYHSHITYNDNAMIQVMHLLRDVAERRHPFAFVDEDRRAKADRAVRLGLDCVLKTQVRQNGKLTSWCAQHDEVTLAPAWGRNFEPPSLSGGESVAIVRFLMEIERPTPEVVDAIEGAVAWLREVAIRGIRRDRGVNAEGLHDAFIVADPSAGPLWARFYELGSNRPIFTGRDKVIRYSFAEIERERRAGYSYHGNAADSLLAKDYPGWRAKHKQTAAP